MDQASTGQDTYIVRLADALQLADALCARLCHDLSSPLGTLVGALDLAEEDPAFLAEALPLASQSALAMTRRMRLLRAAWGGDCGCYTSAELAVLAAGLPSRVQVDVSQLADGPFDATMSRMLLNLMLVAAEALPRGGTLRLIGGVEIVVAVEGPSATWPETLLTAMTDLADAPLGDPRTVQSPLIVMLARSMGLRLSLLLPPGPAAGVPPIILAPL